MSGNQTPPQGPLARRTQHIMPALEKRHPPRSFLVHLRNMGLPVAELRQFLRVCAQPLRPSMRVNCIKAPDDIITKLQLSGWRVSRVPWCRDGYFVDSPLRESIGKTLPHLTGQIYSQEATSMLPVEAARAAIDQGHLELDSGEELQVLDLCAAPGSKTTQIGTWLKGRGLIVANEPNLARSQVLRTNMIRAGVTNFVVTRLDGRTVGVMAPEAFHIVFVDVPCSSEGNIRKDCNAWNWWGKMSHQKELKKLTAVQWQLIQSGWAAVRPGGLLFFSTCTMNRYENEDHCHRLLNSGTGTRALDLPFLLQLPAAASETGFLRIWPQTYNTEGFFVAGFRKEQEADVEEKLCRGGTGVSLARVLNSSGTSHSFEELDVDRITALSREASDRHGFWPSDSQALVEDLTGTVWLPPHFHGSSVVQLALKATAPGIRIASRSPKGGFSLSAEFYLLAGNRCNAAASRMGRRGWAAVAAEVENSVTSLNLLMGFHASAGKWACALEITRRMHYSRLQADLVTYSTLIKAFAKSGDLLRGKQILSQMRQFSVEPNVVTYNTLLAAYARSGDIRGAEHILMDMR